MRPLPVPQRELSRSRACTVPCAEVAVLRRSRVAFIEQRSQRSASPANSMSASTSTDPMRRLGRPCHRPGGSAAQHRAPARQTCRAAAGLSIARSETDSSAASTAVSRASSADPASATFAYAIVDSRWRTASKARRSRVSSVGNAAASSTEGSRRAVAISPAKPSSCRGSTRTDRRRPCAVQRRAAARLRHVSAMLLDRDQRRSARRRLCAAEGSSVAGPAPLGAKMARPTDVVCRCIARRLPKRESSSCREASRLIDCVECAIECLFLGFRRNRYELSRSALKEPSPRLMTGARSRAREARASAGGYGRDLPPGSALRRARAADEPALEPARLRSTSGTGRGSTARSRKPRSSTTRLDRIFG